jgi:hypothetical protein
MFGVLRRRRVPVAVAGWMFGVSSVFYVGAIAVLTIVAVQVAGDTDPLPGLQSATAALLGLLCALGAAYALLRRDGLRRRLGRPWDRRDSRSAGAPRRAVAAARRIRGWEPSWPRSG